MAPFLALPATASAPITIRALWRVGAVFMDPVLPGLFLQSLSLFVLSFPLPLRAFILLMLLLPRGNDLLFNSFDRRQLNALERPWPLDASGSRTQLYSLGEERSFSLRVLPDITFGKAEVRVALGFDTEYVFLGRPHACFELLAAFKGLFLESHCVGGSEESREIHQLPRPADCARSEP